jgi:hypothetical protein
MIDAIELTPSQKALIDYLEEMKKLRSSGSMLSKLLIKAMAEGEGFEPPLPARVKRFSRPPVSTTHTSLRVPDLFSSVYVY